MISVIINFEVSFLSQIIVFFLINNVFDLMGVRGAASEMVNQTANILGSREPGQFAKPVVQELQRGNLV